MIGFDGIYPLPWQRTLCAQREKREHAFALYTALNCFYFSYVWCHVLKFWARKEMATEAEGRLRLSAGDDEPDVPTSIKKYILDNRPLK